MKKLLKKICLPIFLSVLCGFLCGRLMFSIYEDKGSSLLDSNVIYLLEDASYEDIDSMKASTLSSNYMYYEEDGNYKAVVAMTKNKNNIEKIRSVYDNELTISQYLLNDENAIEFNTDLLINVFESQKIPEFYKRLMVYKYILYNLHMLFYTICLFVL